MISGNINVFPRVVKRRSRLFAIFAFGAQGPRRESAGGRQLVADKHIVTRAPFQQRVAALRHEGKVFAEEITQLLGVKVRQMRKGACVAMRQLRKFFQNLGG